jgi:asparagine synthase (glutamine-hydrolysing)
MCGIVGFTGQKNMEVLQSMNLNQAHRGPDEYGIYTNELEDVSLAMRRLSIVDINEGHQPMSSIDGSLWIVFNGEIFNAPDLRKELVSKGYTFKTHHSDTEVLIYMYKQYGKAMLSYLNGMFAFVIYDRDKRKLFGARDRFGIKPFYYSLSGGRITFASELKSLLVCPWIDREVDIQAAYDFFTFQTIPAPYSIFKSIKKLASGNYFEYDLATNNLSTDIFWQPSFSGNQIKESELPEYKNLIKSGFLNAVSRWSQSDVEIACSLSGGIDSSVIVAALAQISSYKIKTYTVGYVDAPDMDEKILAKKVAEKWETNHNEIIVKADDLLDSLDEMVYHLDEPYAGGLPSWFVYKAMQKNVKVAMTGTGGDELFGNYGKWINLENKRDHFYKIREYIKNGGKLIHALKYPYSCLHYPYFSDGVKMNNLFQPTLMNRIRPSAFYIQKSWLNNRYSVRDSVANVDLALQLPEEFLSMTDRFSMACSIEARTPFLDNDFSSLILSLPSSFRTSSKMLKYLFIESIKEWLPNEVITGPKKGFTLPLAHWLRNQLKEKVEYYLNERYIKEQGIFQTDIYDKIAKPFYKGENQDCWKIWTFLMFQLWYEKFVKSDCISFKLGS